VMSFATGLCGKKKTEMGEKWMVSERAKSKDYGGGGGKKRPQTERREKKSPIRGVEGHLLERPQFGTQK